MFFFNFLSWKIIKREKNRMRRELRVHLSAPLIFFPFYNFPAQKIFLKNVSITSDVEV